MFRLKSAHHQIALQDNEKHSTAFEANGRLHQFRRVPFGVTSGVSCFQRIMNDDVIERNGLNCTYAYLDNVLICGKSKEEHNSNLNKFYKVLRKEGITLNEDKSIIAETSIQFLGYLLSHKKIKPDPERLEPLKNLPLPNNMAC